MYTYNVNNVKITATQELPQDELQNYIKYLEDKTGERIQSIDINVDGEFVDLDYKIVQVPFERIRRITGYLVGTMEKWNNAKCAEEMQRVKHSISK